MYFGITSQKSVKVSHDREVGIKLLQEQIDNLKQQILAYEPGIVILKSSWLAACLIVEFPENFDYTTMGKKLDLIIEEYVPTQIELESEVKTYNLGSNFLNF